MIRSARAWLVAAVAGATVSLLSCSLLVDLSDLTGAGGGDSSTSDAALDAPKTAAGDSGPALDAGQNGDAGDAMSGGDATIDASGRVTAGLVALYNFNETSGTIVHDVSGVTPALDLAIAAGDGGAPAKFSSGSLTVTTSLIASGGPATKIIDACKASSEVTLEAWVTPANTAQGPVRIAGVSAGYGDHDVGLDQSSKQYDSILRAPNGSGIELLSPSGTATTTLTHVLVTRPTGGTRTLYVNGVSVASDTPATDPTAWDPSFQLTMGNAVSFDAPWSGSFHLVAIYSRALTAAEAAQNFGAGPR